MDSRNETAFRTAADQAYAMLKRRILAGDIVPGRKIDQDAEARRLLLSRMPIREAIRRLEVEGLVDVVRHRGVVVKPLGLDDLEDLYFLRIELESLAVRLGARAIREEAISAMRKLVPKLRDLTSGDNLAAWLELDGNFHDVIFAAANRPRLYVQIRSLRQEAERYRSLRHAKPIELRLGLQHHRQMIAACERKNGEEAERLMRIAMERSLGIVRKLLITWRDANRGER